jgi:hypothetical protein
MKRALTFAAVAEIATGAALLIAPSLVGGLLLSEELSGNAIPVARVAGIALVALGKLSAADSKALYAARSVTCRNVWK